MKNSRSDLQNCDQEPIHIIGHIQSYGYLLVLDPETQKVVQASENIQQLLDIPADEIIGSALDDLFSFAFLDYFNQIVTQGPEEDSHSINFEVRNRKYVLTTHYSSEGFWVLEIEPFEKGFGHTIGSALRRMILSALEAPSIVSVKIQGVAHEYTAVEGIIEDMTHVVLNLKGALLRKIPLDENNDTRATVKFSKFGEKNLLLRFAKLNKV